MIRPGAAGWRSRTILRFPSAVLRVTFACKAAIIWRTPPLKRIEGWKIRLPPKYEPPAKIFLRRRRGGFAVAARGGGGAICLAQRDDGRRRGCDGHRVSSAREKPDGWRHGW